MAKKVLMTWGGWQGHEPEACTNIMADVLREEGLDVAVYNTLDVFTDAEKMEGLDLVVPCWTMSDISQEQSEGLREAIMKGVGLAGWHGGMCDAFRQDVNYQWMTGANWVSHPGGVIDYEVNILDKHDPVTRGLGDFKMHSEQYYLHTDPGNKVLVTTTFDGEHAPWVAGTVMPQVWKRHWGEGRVFYSALGHVAADFDVPEVKEIMKRGMLWAARVND